MGQSIDISHLGKYLWRSYEKHYKNAIDILEVTPENFSEESHDLAYKIAEANTQKELEAGIQTIQYQINTLMTTNGQAPFVTIFLNLNPQDWHAKENAKIIEEILKQRIQGIKNESGAYITPAFPKLVYVLDEHNVDKEGEYRYLTDLAIECTAKRMYPDYISAKVMKENHEGNVFAPIDQLVA